MGSDTITERLGAAIKAGRQARSWSQQELAERIETSPNFVGQLERAERSPSFAMLGELTLALGLSIDAVIGDIEPAHDFAAEAQMLLASIAPECHDVALDFLRMLAIRRPSRPPESRRQRRGKRQGKRRER